MKIQEAIKKAREVKRDYYRTKWVNELMENDFAFEEGMEDEAIEEVDSYGCEQEELFGMTSEDVLAEDWEVKA